MHVLSLPEANKRTQHRMLTQLFDPDACLTSGEVSRSDSISELRFVSFANSDFEVSHEDHRG